MDIFSCVVVLQCAQPLLTLNKPYHQPFNYLEYVKDSNPDVHIKIFKVAIKTNSETNDA